MGNHIDRRLEAPLPGQLKMKLNPFTLSFPEDDQESAFRESHTERFLLNMRYAILLGAFAYFIFIPINRYLFPGQRTALTLLQLVELPFGAVAFILTYAKKVRKYIDKILALKLAWIGISVSLMIVIAAKPFAYRLSMGLLLNFIFIYIIFKFRFVVAAVSGWTTVLFYFLAIGYFTDIPPVTFFFDGFFIFTYNIFGMVACYTIEYYMRKEYFLSRHINKLEGLLPICSNCKKMPAEEENRKDPDTWIPLETYISEKADVDFTHGLCPRCAKELYGAYLEGKT